MVPEGLVFRRRGFEHLGRQCQRLVHGLFHVLKLALQVVNFYFIAHGSDITPEKLWCEEEIWCNNTLVPALRGSLLLWTVRRAGVGTF